MKSKNLNTKRKRTKWISAIGMATAVVMLFSFTVKKVTGDFLKQLGLTKVAADEKIAQSLLGGYINTYGLTNLKSIALGDRTAVTKDLLQYIKTYAATTAFKKEYNEMKQQHKPTLSTTETPEALRKEGIEAAQKSVKEIEGYLKNADASLKPVFEKTLEDAKKNLKDQQDPANKMYANYTKNYPGLVQSMEESNKNILKKWEEEYPENQLLYIKNQLQKFLANTEDIDFAAETVNKNGKKIFVQPEYERKSYYWKMAYRAGKEVVEPSRVFVTQWLQEIK